MIFLNSLLLSRSACIDKYVMHVSCLPVLSWSCSPTKCQCAPNVPTAKVARTPFSFGVFVVRRVLVLFGFCSFLFFFSFVCILHNLYASLFCLSLFVLLRLILLSLGSDISLSGKKVNQLLSCVSLARPTKEISLIKQSHSVLNSTRLDSVMMITHCTIWLKLVYIIYGIIYIVCIYINK